MSSCPVCDQPIPDGARFCGSCGHQMPEAAKHAELVGKTIANRYRVLRVVAEGGMGIVYEAEQSMGEGVRKVAIKTLLPELSRDPIVVSRFHRECSVVAGLDHPNTVRVYDFGSTDDGTLYIAMEFVRGRPLGDVIAEGPMPLPRAMAILEQVTSALEEAHNQGIVHRDLKPDNLVLCDRAGLHDFVKVLDFGIAKRSSAGGKHDTNLTQQGMVLGTPPYMSPEQFSGEVLDRTSDVYSLAIIFYEMLNGRLPFEGDTPWQWAHQHMTATPAPFSVAVPPAIEQVVKSALSKVRGERPPTASEFYRRLATCLSTASGAHSRILAPTSAIPVVRNPLPLGDASRAALGIGLHTEPSMIRHDGPSTVDGEAGANGDEPHTEPAIAPVLPFGSGGSGTDPSFIAGAAAGTEPGAASLIRSSGALGTHPQSPEAMHTGVRLPQHPTNLQRSNLPQRKRSGKAAILVTLTILGIAGSATAIGIWAQSRRNGDAAPPRPSLSAPPETVEVAAETPYFPAPASTGAASPLPQITYRPASAPKAASSGVPSASSPIPSTAPPATPATSPPPTTTAPPPSNPLPFPFPITIPSVFTPPGLPPITTPPATQPTVTPPTTPAPAAAGMQNCANATAMAASNIDAAVTQYQSCEAAVGAAAANPTRAQIVAIGVAQARALADQGRCQEANRVAQTMARIGAERPALNAIARSKACR